MLKYLNSLKKKKNKKSKELRRKSLKLTSYIRLLHPQTYITYKDC